MLPNKFNISIMRRGFLLNLSMYKKFIRVLLMVERSISFRNSGISRTNEIKQIKEITALIKYINKRYQKLNKKKVILLR